MFQTQTPRSAGLLWRLEGLGHAIVLGVEACAPRALLVDPDAKIIDEPLHLID